MHLHLYIKETERGGRGRCGGAWSAPTRRLWAHARLSAGLLAEATVEAEAVVVAGPLGELRTLQRTGAVEYGAQRFVARDACTSTGRLHCTHSLQAHQDPGP